MGCDAVLELLSAWVDGEVDAGQSTAVEAHLSTCGDCRAAADGFRVQDAALVRAFTPAREAARNVADRALNRLAADSPTPGATTKPMSWPVLFAATAAGFLLAVMIFRPWEPAAINNPPPLALPPTPPLYAATLVVATGNVELQEPDDDVWQVLPDSTVAGCPTGSVVRTGPDVRCELETVDGDTLRLDYETEMRLVEKNAVQIQRGRIWCRANDGSSLRVLGPDHGSPEGLQWANGPAGSSMMVEVKTDQSVRVTSAHGSVEIKTATGEALLDRGQTAAVKGNTVDTSPDTIDLMLDSQWINSILMRKGHGDGELKGRVNALMAEIGQSKMSNLYEDEVRALGEYAVLPLLSYIQSPISRHEPRRRSLAADVVADFATSWSVGELVELLSDEHPDVRFHAARALRRLTGTGQRMQPEDWRSNDPDRRDAALLRWRAWWQENKKRFPAPDDLKVRFQ